MYHIFFHDIGSIKSLLAKDICYTYLWLFFPFTLFSSSQGGSTRVWSASVNRTASDLTHGGPKKISSGGSGTEERFVDSDDILQELRISSWWYFWKWCWIRNCVHGFDPKLHVWGENCKKKFSLDMFVTKFKQKNFLAWTQYLQKPLEALETFKNHC